LSTKCSLCQLSVDHKWIVVICKTCNVPMFVYQFHSEPSQKELDEAVKLAKKLFPGRTVDLTRRSIPDHAHFHMR